MSISATRRVSGSSNATRTERYNASRGNSEAFVEHIDTTNNVLVNNEARNNEDFPQKPKDQQEQSQQQQPNSQNNKAYVPNAIEALAASGVYDEDNSNYNSTKKVGVYDNNQSIVKEELPEKIPQSYLKHFYEHNRPIEEVDELV